MKAIEKELDRLVQQLHKGQICRVCKKEDAIAMHHIIGRANPMLRYDLINLLPVCFDCHGMIHDEGLDAFRFISKEQVQYLKQVQNESYKDFLIFEVQMTEDEYLKQCRKTLKSLLNK
jgi:hypothetical protein